MIEYADYSYNALLNFRYILNVSTQLTVKLNIFKAKLNSEITSLKVVEIFKNLLYLRRQH